MNEQSTPSKGNILVVDDTPDTLELLATILSVAGYTVRTAPSGELALMSIGSILPDLIVLDIMMPQMNGYEVCQILKASPTIKDIPVIFISALNEAFDKVEAFSLGGADYITKPFHMQEVVARVENQLRQTRLSKQLQQQNVRLQKEIESRRQTEEVLRQSRQLLGSVLDSSLDGIVAFRALRNSQGNIVDFEWLLVNPAAEKIIGRTATELMGQDLLEALPGNRQVGLFDLYVQVVETGVALETELYYQYDGIKAWFQIVVVKLGDGFAATFRDITARKQAELALERQLHRSRLIARIKNEIRSQLDARALFESAAIHIGRAFGASRSLIHTYIASPTPKIPLLGQYLAPGYTTLMNVEILVAGYPHIERLLSQERAISVNDVYAEALLQDAQSLCRQLEIKSMLGVRTSYQGKPNGLIGFHQCDRFREWTEEEIELIEAIATQLGIAIAQAQLLEQEKQARAELDRQNQTLQQEISDRKRAEEKLRQSKHFIERIADASPYILYIYDLIEQRNIYANRETAEILGYTSEQLQAMGEQIIVTIFHPDDLAGILEHRQRSKRASDGEILEIEYRIRDANGEWRTFFGRETPFARTPDGEVKQVIGTAIDISARKQAELALKLANERLQYLLTSSQAVIYCSKPWENYQTSFISENISEIAGYEAREFVEDTSFWVRRIHPDDRERVLARVAQALEVGSYSNEYRFLHADGTYHWFYDQARLVRDCVGNPIECVGYWVDISDRKRAEEAVQQSEAREREKAQALELTLDELKRTQAQLIQTEKMSSLGRMVAGIAHEINNPVSFIYGNLAHARHYFQDLLRLTELYRQIYPNPTPEIEALSEEIELEFVLEDWSKLINSMQVGTERIREIVISLRNFSRLDEKELKAVDIHEGIDNTLLILQHRLRAVGADQEIKVIKDYGQLPRVTCYPSQLNQVFMNLLSNAIDALENQPAPRLITIRTLLIQTSKLCGRASTFGDLLAKPDAFKHQNEMLQFVVIRIADNGAGMSEEVQQKIFDPFFTTKDVGSGTGLGLSICYQIVVEKHKGRISCISTLGQGTEVIVEIPVKIPKS